MSPSETRPARILAVCEAPIPSAVLGVHAVFGALQERTRECELRTASSVSPDVEDVAWADTVVLVRGASPGERRLLDEAKRLGKRVATYLDDDLERVPESARSGYFFTSTKVRGNVASIVRDADDVLVCSDRLGAELSARHGRRCTRVLQPRPPRLPGESLVRAPDLPVRIGFLGSVDHGPFLDQLLGDVLPEIRRELGSDVEFVFCGAEPRVAAKVAALCRPFEPDFTSWRRLARDLRIAIGLAPLPDSEFHRFKYWNKYLEYGSLGIAGIYSDVAPHADVVRDGATGLVRPNAPEAWHAALRLLAQDSGLRQRLGHAAYLDVEARFSAGALVPHWRASLGPLLSHRAPTCSPADVRLRTGPVWHALDRLAIYGPVRFADRALGRLTGRLRAG